MEYLVIVVDHEKGIVGSRHISDDLWFKYGRQDDEWLQNYLKREFPGLDFDDVLIIDRDLKIKEEWFRGISRVHG